MNLQVVLDASQGLLGWLWRASCQASVVVVIVLMAQWLLRKQLTPRWRHALWFLVFIRLALPFSLETPVSLFNWFHPKLPAAGPVKSVEGGPGRAASPQEPAETPVPAMVARPSWPTALAAVWLGGALLLPGYLLASAWWLGRTVRRQRPLTDGAVLDLLEDCKAEMGVSVPLTLVETPAVASPSLFGCVRPRLLLPAGFTRSFTLDELRYVFLHELGHLRRGDIPLNWLTTAILTVHWVNPLAWFAANRMRVDGELACDALALSHTRESENRSYGQTILKLLERFSRPATAPCLVGILEDKNQMKQRISMIAKFKKTTGWPIAATALFGALALVTLTDGQRAASAAGEAEASAPGGANAGGPPVIVSTSPRVGETDVDPGLAQITVTFDRDMGGGFSWTGGGPDYPPGVPGQKAHWSDKRTCVMPVKLAAGHYYRVGINSTSYQNFRSANGVPARPSAIYFTTRGASEELKQKTAKPSIVAIEPKNGASDVDPALKELRITFNVPMGGGFSWTGGGPAFPTIPQGKKPFWTEDRMTCVLPVELKPGWEYHLGLNSPSHKNFQSAGGVPLDPVSYTFKTRN